MVAVLSDQHVGDQPGGGEAARDRPRRRQRLGDALAARAAGVFGAARHHHPELRRDDVELLGHVLADPVQRPAAARARRGLGFENRLDPRQMRRQGAPVAVLLLPAPRRELVGGR